MTSFSIKRLRVGDIIETKVDDYSTEDIWLQQDYVRKEKMTTICNVGYFLGADAKTLRTYSLYNPETGAISQVSWIPRGSIISIQKLRGTRTRSRRKASKSRSRTA